MACRVKPDIVWTPDPDTRERMRVVCRALRTSYTDFIGFAVNQSIDELEALAREQKAINDYYGRNHDGR